ncbi:GDYXXLXY domain-containing protein [Fluviicola taffensis]|uniref:GDYXXLXY protein n=1 Tax=Fluviicola taffensis (strain DSM 16823 / NCIMB 13979 / RW262) TaxID=755732 RepID=F2IGY5_FLUTR|nr:GDYXXLXY domain-containing protein [Fluviicola taffensis]AEA44766.1 hypothetical protein Fluta_2786 [Fluviicola taffensis DSM 16823]
MINWKRNLIIANMMLVFGVFGWMVFQKEELIKNGEILVLKLQPVDPRSFMMGDYMTLNYAINNDISTNSFDFENINIMGSRPYDGPLRRKVVVKMQDSLAVFVRIKNKKPLAKGEFELPCKNTYFNYEIQPNEYLFQEGRSKHFDQAEYAQFRVNKSGDVVIECLLDKNWKQLR